MILFVVHVFNVNVIHHLYLVTIYLVICKLNINLKIQYVHSPRDEDKALDSYLPT